MGREDRSVRKCCRCGAMQLGGQWWVFEQEGVFLGGRVGWKRAGGDFFFKVFVPFSSDVMSLICATAVQRSL